MEEYQNGYFCPAFTAYNRVLVKAIRYDWNYWFWIFWE